MGNLWLTIAVIGQEVILGFLCVPMRDGMLGLLGYAPLLNSTNSLLQKLFIGRNILAGLLNTGVVH